MQRIHFSFLVAALVLCIAIAPPPCAADTAGPDAFGYRSIDSLEQGGPLFQFIDISLTGTQLTFFDADALPTQNSNADDGVALNISLASLNQGFGFPFYGKFESSVNMSTNGFLHFQLNGSSDSLSNNCPIANAAEPNEIIAVLWDDLVLRNPPSVIAGGYMQAFSPCPNTQGGAWNCVIFQWDNADHFGGGIDAFDFQAILYDNGNILMNFPSGNPEAGNGSTTGLENGDASIGLTHKCDTAQSLPPDFAVLFRHPSVNGPTVYESEENATTDTASALPINTCGIGNIRVAGDIDVWSTPGVAQGQLLFALTDTQSAAPSADSVLTATAGDGTTVLLQDNDSGSGLGSAIAGVPITQTGNLFLTVNENGNDAASSIYRLTTLVLSPDDNRAEIESNDTTGAATPVIASRMTGGFSTGADVDVYSFAAKEGDGIAAIVNNDPDNNAVFSDPLVEILDPNGAQIGVSNSGQGTRGTGVGTIAAPVTGIYFVRLTDNGGLDSDYDLAVSVNCGPTCADGDLDTVCDTIDNCLGVANPDQKDSDGDEVGDDCETCDDDPAKTAPGFCGCGTADVDSNSNGVLDCRSGSELRARLTTLQTAVKALKGPKTSKTKISAVKLKLTDAVTFGNASAGSITLTGDIALSARLSRLSAAVNKSTKVSSSNFAAKKAAALKAIRALFDAVGAD